MAGAGAKVRAPRAQPFEEALAAVVELIGALDRPAAVIGGIAVVAHGFARATADIDLAVVAEPDESAELFRVARAAGFEARIADAVSFAETNLVLLLVHAPTGVPVDLSIAMQPFEREAAERRVIRKLGAVSVPVTPLDALVVYKMVAGRSKDLDDVRALLSTGAALDLKAVEQLLSEFDALLGTDRVAELRKLTRRG